MSRPKSQNARKGPQLPFALQQKLGLPRSNRKQRTHKSDRKQRRQEERRDGGDSRQQHSTKLARHPYPKENTHDTHETLELGHDEDDEEPYEDLNEPEALKQLPSKRTIELHGAAQRNTSMSISPPPSPSLDDESDSLSRGSREYSPEIVLDANSRTFRDKQAEEDADILALEKKLGMKNKQKDILDDGYDDLLGSLDAAVGLKKRQREERDWLAQKRRKVRELDDAAGLNDIGNGSAFEEDSFEGFEAKDMDGEGIGYVDNDSSDNALADPTPPRRPPVRENPYVAPVGNGSAKYIPPSRRKSTETDTAKLDKLRRQAQGSLNKLSEANIISIVDEFDKLYQMNPRQDTNTVLIDLLLAAFSDPSALQNTYIILHAAFVSALYKILGADFGAEMISKLVETFDRYHNDKSVTGKEALNLTSLVANLFTFGVISSALVYDHIRLLLSGFGENSAELLLRILRDCGPQLRSDDPTALKGIVRMMNEVSARMTSSGQTVNIRTRVMMDTITDLKNNKIRQATNNAGATGEHLTRMRKALGTLNSRQLRATEPLGITRADILNSDKKGKWWLVGASWKGHQRPDPVQPLSQPMVPSRDASITTSDPNEIDYPSLFAHHKLTSPVHRSIFIAVTGAEDATDALQRISKLRLTRKQELEIAPVLLRCVRAEQTYNPYYGVLAKMLLREKKYKMSFSIALWKLFSLIGERQDEGSDDEDMSSREDAVQVFEISNVAKMYAYLVARGCLRLDILKTLNIGLTKENASLFLEVFFIALLAQNQGMSDEKRAVDVFSGVSARQANSVAYFLRKCVRCSDLVVNSDEAKKVKRGCNMAVAALAAMERRGMGDEDE